MKSKEYIFSLTCKDSDDVTIEAKQTSNQNLYSKQRKSNQSLISINLYIGKEKGKYIRKSGKIIISTRGASRRN